MQNITLPIVLGLVSAAIFAALVNYLLKTSAWVEHTDRVIASGQSLQRKILDAETALRGFMISREERFLPPLELTLTTWDEDFATLKKLTADNPLQTERLARMGASYAVWRAYVDRVLNWVRAGEQDNGKAKAFAIESRILIDEFRRSFLEFVNEEEVLRETRGQETHAFARMVLASVILISLFFSALIAWVGRRQLVSLSASYEAVLEKTQSQNERLLRESWLEKGRSEIGTQLVGQHTLQRLGEKTLSTLVDFLEAQVGTFFVMDRHGHGNFRRIAAYGISSSELNQRADFKMGEGLLGITCKEGRPKIVTNLPPEHFRLTSGVGESQAKSLVIFPFRMGEDVNAVVELGFLGDRQERTLEFLQNAAGSIANAVQAARYRDQLEELLSEVQNQSEELQAQQEELRVSNEELQEQTRLLRESQERSDNQNAELQQTNTQLEEQTQLLEEQKNLLDRRNDELNRTRKDIELKASELSRASHYKSEFLANMSHELRTPLNSALILSQLLAENRSGNLNEQQVEYAHQITRCGRDLLLLINDVLDISKVESGKMDVSPEEFSLESLVRGLSSMFAPLAKEKSLDFAVERQTPHQELETDRQRLEQILKNMISNALKFTEKGQVRVLVTDSKANPKNMIFAVHDTGIGIQQENLEVIFEAFRQADGTTSRKYGGTGLGLSISRELARLLGGEIRVESEAGKGSTFYLEIPRRFEASKPRVSDEDVAKNPVQHFDPMSGDSNSSSFSSLSDSGSYGNQDGQPMEFKVEEPARSVAENRGVLIIEDDPVFAKIMQELVEELGFQPVHCDTAESGLQYAQEQQPFAIILDMKLPDYSGLFVLDRLKTDRRTRHIPVHIASVEDYSNSAMQMGAAGYLLKPLKREELGKALLEMRRRLSERNQRVLVIEDDEAQRLAIRGLIEGKRVKITTATTGKEALELMQTEEFDCIVLDLTLPDTSGLSLLEKMAEDKSRRYPPVIVYTGRELSNTEESQLKRYSQSIIVKGARSPERLLDEVTLFLHRVESQLPVNHQKALHELRSREQVLLGRNLLLVDDDMRNVFALTAALEQRGASLRVARNGLEAVELLQKSGSANGPKIDLVLMDVMMPVMNGYEAMREIRKMPQHRKLPIIALTAKAMKDDRDQCLEAGASDYLPKPVQIDKLLSLIRVWMSSHSGARR